MRIGERGAGAILLLAACLGVASCSGDGSDDPEAYDYERACGLLTDEEAADVLGVPVHDGEADFDRTIAESYCQWIARGSSTFEGELAYTVFVSEATSKGALEAFDENGADPDATAVRGVGDEAYLYPPGEDSFPFLTVRVDDHVATIGVEGDDDHPVSEDDAARMERVAAEFVAGRL